MVKKLGTWNCISLCNYDTFVLFSVHVALVTENTPRFSYRAL